MNRINAPKKSKEFPMMVWWHVMTIPHSSRALIMAHVKHWAKCMIGLEAQIMLGSDMAWRSRFSLQLLGQRRQPGTTAPNASLSSNDADFGRSRQFRQFTVGFIRFIVQIHMIWLYPVAFTCRAVERWFAECEDQRFGLWALGWSCALCARMQGEHAATIAAVPNPLQKARSSRSNP